MISRIKRLGLPIKVYGSGNDTNAIIEWGKTYWSKKEWNDFVPKEFTLYFPESPMSITECKTMTNYEVYPDDWSLFVSNDNKTYYNIIKNQSMCDSMHQIKFDNKLFCQKDIIFKHKATKIENCFYFVKFVMTKNSYF